MAPITFSRSLPNVFHFVIFLLLCLFFGQTVRAQFIYHLPEDHPNTRFMADAPHIDMTPRLTFAGFSGENSRALGLRQFLSQAANDRDSPAFATLEKIIEKAGQAMPEDPDIHQIEQATNILQYLAFETLAALLMEQNGEIPGQSMIFNGVHIRPHTELIKQLRRALVSLSEVDKLVTMLTEVQHVFDYLDT